MRNNYKAVHGPFGGMLWVGRNLAETDGGWSIMEQFLDENPHDDWTLSIFDSITELTIEIDCRLSEMSAIVAYIYNLEHATPMTFIGENLMTESYVVGMACTRGILNIPGIYRAENGKLISLI